MKVEEAITHHWGERCDDHEEGCPVCDAWHEYDALLNHKRKPLTENEIKHLWYEACQTNLELTSQLIVHLARNIEAAHGIKELV